MKKKHLLMSLLLVTLFCTICACDRKPQYADSIVNGDFEAEHETGKWANWVREDAAFNVRGLVNSEKLNGAVMEKSGTYYFAGCEGGNPTMRGTLTSDIFTLGGNGFITFKMGAAFNTDKVYVEFFEAGKETALARITNDDCDGLFITDHLITKIVDLSAHIGKNIYIKVTDNDDGNNLSYINLDAFKICTTEQEVADARAEYDLQIATYGPKPFEEDETSVTIQNPGFETGDLSGWVTLEGTALSRAGIVSTKQYYWTDRSVYGEGDYYLDGNNNGTIAENLTGAIRSSKFTLSGDGYISFMIGAGNGNSYVALCDAATDEELIIVHNDYFSDPALALTLLRVYMDAGEYLGKVVYLKVTDGNDGGGFAFINVDDFRVSLTEEDVAVLEVEQLEKIKQETYTSASYNDLVSLLNYYNSYPYPVPLASLTMNSYVEHQVVDCGIINVSALLSSASATYGKTEIKDFRVKKITHNFEEIATNFDSVDMSNPGIYHVTYETTHLDKTIEATFTILAKDSDTSIANGNFESGNLAGWTILADTWSRIEGHAAGVISASSYWGENLPYNQGGMYHLDGWNNGIPEPEGWEIRSTNFILSGAGYISARMGGNSAAIKVFLADGTQVGYFKQNRFSDINFPSLKAGGSWADMGTYVMDLREYLGQEMYLVLCDEVIDGGWAQAFFDEIITYYETAPDPAGTYDIVADGATAEEVRIYWQAAKNLK